MGDWVQQMQSARHWGNNKRRLFGLHQHLARRLWIESLIRVKQTTTSKLATESAADSKCSVATFDLSLSLSLAIPSILQLRTVRHIYLYTVLVLYSPGGLFFRRIAHISVWTDAYRYVIETPRWSNDGRIPLYTARTVQLHTSSMCGSRFFYF